MKEKKIKVLILDHDPVLSNIFREYLEAVGGFEVSGIAENDTLAVKFIEKTDIDIIVVDFIVSKIDILGFMKKVNNIKFKNRPVVVILTYMEDEEVIEESMKLGVDYYIIKPIDLGEFAKKIKVLFQVK